jgi:hypothetical protein
MNDTAFWDIVSCSSYVNRRFGGTYHHFQGRKSGQATALSFLARPIFDPEDVGDSFLRHLFLFLILGVASCCVRY